MPRAANNDIRQEGRHTQAVAACCAGTLRNAAIGATVPFHATVGCAIATSQRFACQRPQLGCVLASGHS